MLKSVLSRGISRWLSLGALRHDLTCYFVEQRTLSVSSAREKSRSDSLIRSLVCVRATSLLSPPPDNLFKARDKAISGKETALRSKQWVPSQSPPPPVPLFLFSFCTEWRLKTDAYFFLLKKMWLSCQNLCSNHQPIPPTTPSLVFSCLTHPTTDLKKKRKCWTNVLTICWTCQPTAWIPEPFFFCSVAGFIVPLRGAADVVQVLVFIKTQTPGWRVHSA